MAVYAIGNIIETFSSGSLPALYIGRLVAGAGIGACTVVGPVAIVEIAPAATRGLMTLWFNVCMLSSQMVGIFTVFGCDRHVSRDTNLQYQIPFFVQCFVPAIGITMSFFLHESPRWLCLRGRHEEAFSTLVTIRGLGQDHAYLVAEWDQMRDQVAREKEEFGGLGYISILRETFCVRANLRRVQLVVVAYILAQFSGANSVTNYLPEIFGIVGVESTDVKVYASGLYALAKLVCCVAASLLFVDVVGRRKSLFIGITVQMLCHSYLAGYLSFFVRDEDSVPKGASDAAIGVIYIHAFGWAVGKKPLFDAISLSNIKNLYNRRPLYPPIPVWRGALAQQASLLWWLTFAMFPLALLLRYHQGNPISPQLYESVGRFCLLCRLVLYCHHLRIHLGSGNCWPSFGKHRRPLPAPLVHDEEVCAHKYYGHR